LGTKCYRHQINGGMWNKQEFKWLKSRWSLVASNVVFVRYGVNHEKVGLTGIEEKGYEKVHDLEEEGKQRNKCPLGS